MKKKVIGIGFHKTGTSTLGRCLSLLGNNHVGCCKQGFLLYQTSEISALLKIMEFYDSFDDWPWPLIYKEAFEKFPDAKFILTTRLNEEVWFNSLLKHTHRDAGVDQRIPAIKRYNYRPFIYGDNYEQLDKDHYISRYMRHNREIRDFFADKPGSLLEVCWEKGDDWKELCDFLEVSIPNEVFPHVNKAKSTTEIMWGRLRKAKNILLRG